MRSKPGMPLGPRQSVGICLHLAHMLRKEAQLLTPGETNTFHNALLGDLEMPEALARELVAYLRRP